MLCHAVRHLNCIVTPHIHWPIMAILVLLGFSPVTTKHGHYDTVQQSKKGCCIFSMSSSHSPAPLFYPKQDLVTLLTCILSTGMPSHGRHATWSSVSTQWKHAYVVLNSFFPPLSHKCSVVYWSIYWSGSMPTKQLQKVKTEIYSCRRFSQGMLE